ncbi:MAG: SDR family oxidoreductase [Microcella sp.]|uniref:SDR family oxidoreductase n=1 Tax=Microcella sp. TaxID=1913979 RepID=UPI0033163A22
MTPTVLITGASSGIGRAAAVRFAEEGWNVAATMRNPADAAELAKMDSVLVTRLDVLDRDSIDAAVSAATERFGAIDALVNNAGYGAYGPLETMPMEVLRRQLDVNVLGLLATTQAVLPGMRRRRSGTIVNVSSIGGRMAFPLGTPYHASKWAVEGASEAMHYELRPLGIAVRIVEPGGVATDFGGRSFVASYDDSVEEYLPLTAMLASALSDDDTPAAGMQPSECADVIWQAATHDGDRMRFIAGAQAEQTLASRYDADREEDFLARSRQQFGL